MILINTLKGAKYLDVDSVMYCDLTDCRDQIQSLWNLTKDEEEKRFYSQLMDQITDRQHKLNSEFTYLRPAKRRPALNSGNGEWLQLDEDQNHKFRS